jgi:AcrR family transcriptional regulator
MKSANDSLDLRVRRTYKFLWDALMALMTDHDFEALTVTDICERAMVHRTTFYKHYEDKNGLLFHGIHNELNALVEAIDAAVDKPMETEHTAATKARLIAVFEHVRKHEGFYRLMLTGDGFTNFSTLLRKSLAHRLEQHHQHEGRHMSIPMALHAQLQAASLVSMIAWWLENNCPYTPVEMIQFFNEHIALI